MHRKINIQVEEEESCTLLCICDQLLLDKRRFGHMDLQKNVVLTAFPLRLCPEFDTNLLFITLNGYYFWRNMETLDTTMAYISHSAKQ